MADDFFDTIGPKGAYEIGDSMGRFRTEVEAIKAYDMGEIDQWIAFVRPKSLEEWDEWEAVHVEGFENRWKV